jgi:predicted O-methyltransferase YrrM
MNPVLEEIYRSGVCTDLNGQTKRVTGGVPPEDARVIDEVAALAPVRTSLETGVAFGLSTLVMCDVLRRSNDPSARHYGIDPCQHSEHGGAAIANLRRAGLERYFELRETTSQLALPRLLEEGVTLDLAFIDGWHTFDYTLLDFFYVDKMLRPGGHVILHDYNLPSKRKVVGYILTHRKYEVVTVPSSPKPSIKRRIRGPAQTAWWTLRGAPPQQAGSGLQYIPRIVCLRKVEQFEPNYNFFRGF